MREETVFLPPEVVAAIEGELQYGDSKSEWIREACRRRLRDDDDDDARDQGITAE